MFCLKCGKEIDNSATVCPYCNSLTENAMGGNETFEAKATQPTSSSLGVVAIVMGALGIVLAVLIALLGYIFGGAALAMALVAKGKAGFTKQVAAGLVLSIVALVVAVVNSILGIILYGGF